MGSGGGRDGGGGAVRGDESGANSEAETPAEGGNVPWGCRRAQTSCHAPAAPPNGGGGGGARGSSRQRVLRTFRRFLTSWAV